MFQQAWPGGLPLTSPSPPPIQPFQDLKAQVGLPLLHQQELSLSTKPKVGTPSLIASTTLQPNCQSLPLTVEFLEERDCLYAHHWAQSLEHGR